jgi:hypothetical protein
MPAPRIPHIATRRRSKPDLRRRVQHLAFVRQLPCVACGKARHQRPRMCGPEPMVA